MKVKEALKNVQNSLLKDLAIDLYVLYKYDKMSDREFLDYFKGAMTKEAYLKERLELIEERLNDIDEIDKINSEIGDANILDIKETKLYKKIKKQYEMDNKKGKNK